MYLIKTSVILYSDLDVLDTFHNISLLEAISIYIKDYRYYNVDIYFSSKSYSDALRKLKNREL